MENAAGLRALLSREINIPSHQASLLGLPDLPMVASPASAGSGFGPSHPVEGVVPNEVARALGSDVVRASICVSVQTNTMEDRVSRSYSKMIARERFTHPLYIFLKCLTEMVRVQDPDNVFAVVPEDQDEAEMAMRRDGARRQWRKCVDCMIELAPQVRTICLNAPVRWWPPLNRRAVIMTALQASMRCVEPTVENWLHARELGRIVAPTFTAIHDAVKLGLQADGFGGFPLPWVAEAGSSTRVVYARLPPASLCTFTVWAQEKVRYANG